MTAENAPLVRTQSEDGITTLVLNNPQRRNSLSMAMLNALSEALEAVADDAGTRVVVLAAEGHVFSAGHDLREIREQFDCNEFQLQLFKRCSEVMLQIVRLPKPVIARVAGIATAAGCQLVASCDLAVAADTARFATPGVSIGLFCSTPMVALSRNVSRKHAMEMLLTGESARRLSTGSWKCLWMMPTTTLPASWQKICWPGMPRKGSARFWTSASPSGRTNELKPAQLAEQPASPVTRWSPTLIL